MNDQLDRAVATAMAEPPQEKRGRITLNLSDGREAIIDVPVAMTAIDALAIVGYVANGLAQELAKLAVTPVVEPVRKGLHAVPTGLRPT